MILTAYLDERGELAGFLDEGLELVAELDATVTVGGFVVVAITQNDAGDMLFTLSSGDQVIIGKFFQGPKGDPGPKGSDATPDGAISNLYIDAIVN